MPAARLWHCIEVGHIYCLCYTPTVLAAAAILVVIVIEGIQCRPVVIWGRQLLARRDVLLLLGLHSRHWGMLLWLARRPVLSVAACGRWPRRNVRGRFGAVVAIQGTWISPLLLVRVDVLRHRHRALCAVAEHLLRRRLRALLVRVRWPSVAVQFNGRRSLPCWHAVWGRPALALRVALKLSRVCSSVWQWSVRSPAIWVHASCYRPALLLL